MVPFAGLLAALEQIPDPRRRQGQRYRLAPLLLFTVLAILAGATSYRRIRLFILAHRERLNATGTGVHVEYSCRYFLDVVPAGAGKGNSLAWLCEHLGIAFEQVLVAGDTGNDTSMFLLPGVRGIMVENALPELKAAAIRPTIFPARGENAEGVLDGLRHFQIVPKEPQGPA